MEFMLNDSIAFQLLSKLMNETCATEILSNYNIFHRNCIQLFISQLLGYAIIAGSLILKVPQIMKIVNAKSAEGISLSSVLLELTSMMFTMAYCFRFGHPFSTFGESVFISMQNLVIVLLIFYYGRKFNKLFVSIFSTYFLVLYLLLNPREIISTPIITSLYGTIIPLFISSRIPQIWTNYVNKSSGQLALFTWIMNVGGSAARVFTTIQQTPNDHLMLASFLLAVILNGSILIQILYFGNRNIKEKRI